MFGSAWYWPLTDLPQHAAALSIFAHLGEPSWGFADQFEIHWGTPYLLLYVTARPLVGLLGAVGALKVIALVGVVALPLSLLPLLRWAGLPRGLSLFGFPLALGFSFWFGFLNFSLALPLGFLVLAAGLQTLEAPTLRRGAWLSLSLLGLSLAHGLAASFVAPTLVLFGLLSPGRLSHRLAGLASLGPTALALLLWGTQQSARLGDNNVFDGGWSTDRALDLPAMLLGVHQDDVLALAGGVLLLVAPLALGLRPSREPRRWVPLGVSLLLFFLFPFTMAGVSFLFQRFAVFVPPALWIALSGPAAPPLAPLRSPPVVALFAAIWVGLAGLRVREFDAEARSFEPILEIMEPNRSVRPIFFTFASDALPGSLPYVHFAAYYQAAKGGRIGFSFARNYTSFIRYKPGIDIGMARDDEWHPERFSFEKEGRQYDYFLVRSRADVSARLFPPGAVVHARSSAKFHLYRGTPLPSN